MNASHKFALLTVGSTVSFSALSIPAQANSTGTAADLLPLDAQGVAVAARPDQTKALSAVSVSVQPEIAYSPDLLRSVANNINNAEQPENESNAPDISDVIDLSFIEQFIDEDGNVNLPLGLTVYEAMGTTSIGFGGTF